MKYFRFLPVVSAMLVACSLLSCSSFLNDDDPPTTSLAIATVKVVEGNDYYFGLDDGDTMYPVDKSSIPGYKVKDGQRALVYFSLTDQEVEGYDYTIRVLGIEDVLTKDVILLTEEVADSIGDDKINAVSIRLSKEYLTIQFRLLGTGNPNKPHMLNLVQNLTTPEEAEADNVKDSDDGEYLNLEFRHNAFDDAPMQLSENYVSFKLNNALIDGKKGIKIRVNTLYDGVAYTSLDFPKEEE
jgi:hypothetical protein